MHREVQIIIVIAHIHTHFVAPVLHVSCKNFHPLFPFVLDFTSFEWWKPSPSQLNVEKSAYNNNNNDNNNDDNNNNSSNYNVLTVCSSNKNYSCRWIWIVETVKIKIKVHVRVRCAHSWGASVCARHSQTVYHRQSDNKDE